MKPQALLWLWEANVKPMAYLPNACVIRGTLHPQEAQPNLKEPEAGTKVASEVSSSSWSLPGVFTPAQHQIAHFMYTILSTVICVFD